MCEAKSEPDIILPKGTSRSRDCTSHCKTSRKSNLVEGRVVRGESTICCQLCHKGDKTHIHPKYGI